MRPPLVRLYAFAYKPPFPRLSLSFRSCALLCLLWRESDMDLFECVFCCSVIQAVGGLDLEKGAACVCASHVIGYLACFCPSVFRVNACIAEREIAPPPLRPNFPLPCRFPLPVFNLPRMSNDLLRCVFLLGRAAEFNVPSMRASAVSKRSRPLFARSSSAIVRRSGTRGVVRERFRIRGDGSFRDGLRRMRVCKTRPRLVP